MKNERKAMIISKSFEDNFDFFYNMKNVTCTQNMIAVSFDMLNWSENGDTFLVEQ